MSESLQYGLSQLKERERLEDLLHARNLQLEKDTAAYKLQTRIREPSPCIVEFSRKGFEMEKATSFLKERLNITNKRSVLALRHQGKLVKSREYCGAFREEPSNCDRFSRYRSADGTCNNLKNPTWGAAFMPYGRFAEYDYGDGVSSLRVASDGGDLPSARLVSLAVSSRPETPSSTSLSNLHMSFGQFLDHDLVLTPLVAAPDGAAIACCPEALGGDATLVHPECAAIALPAGDPFYGAFGRTCMEFLRSAPAPTCTFGPREQMNAITPYLDGSAIYGSSLQAMDALRASAGGRLLLQVTGEGVELLPPKKDLHDGCNDPLRASVDQYCFRAGDKRVNEHPALVLFHLLFARHHNLVANRLQELNPRWGDEELFQESRRIVVAQLQHIVYNEYLPTVLGKNAMRKYQLKSLKGKQRRNDYDPSRSAAASSEFATAAFRFGHSQIPDLIERADAAGEVTATTLSSEMLRPFSLYAKGAAPDLLRGSGRQRAGDVDSFFAKEVTGKLFRSNKPFGLDLVALNVQRGRDHGLPGYTALRAACRGGGSKVRDFEDLVEDMDQGVVDSLKRVYSHVDDIDLFIGGVSERPLPSGVLGPTFTCILGDQFSRIRRGDRYWYETSDKDTGFGGDQLEQLRKTTLAGLLCGAFPEVRATQERPLEVASAENPVVSCGCVPSVDLKPWKT
ncbi:peroxidase-like [Penaeus monodon]|uniref:peroxidase-like n=1 Tax=Penaeus monodon TaxID=6687 RepID=UPI0018A72BD8|nr:peroxidase-like [Penaeus monodon]